MNEHVPTIFIFENFSCLFARLEELLLILAQLTKIMIRDIVSTLPFRQTKLSASNKNSASNNSSKSVEANNDKENMSNTSSCKRPAEEIKNVVEIDDIVPTCGPVPFERFLGMWHDVEVNDGWNMEDFENTGSFCKANTSLNKEDTSTQRKVNTDEYSRE